VEATASADSRGLPHQIKGYGTVDPTLRIVILTVIAPLITDELLTQLKLHNATNTVNITLISY
jgi:hypothetical protein